MPDESIRGPVSHEEILARLMQVEGRLADGSEQFREIKDELADMRAADGQQKAMLETMAQDTAATRELVELLTTAKTVGRVAGRFAINMGRIIKWTGGIAAAIVAMFVLWRDVLAQVFHGRG